MAYTQQTWAEQVLADLGVPVTSVNVTDIEHWMAAEEPTTRWWNRNNPLNNGTGSGGGAGLGSYANLTAAAYYVAHNLDTAIYEPIKTVLAKGTANPLTFDAAVEKSPWAGSRYGVAAAGAPSKYIVAGRGLDYLSTTQAVGTTPAPATAGSPTKAVSPTDVQAAAATPALAGASATDTGLDLTPLNGFGVPGEILTLGKKAVGSALSPVVDEIENVGLVFLGVILIVVGLIVVAFVGVRSASGAGGKAKNAASTAQGAHQSVQRRRSAGKAGGAGGGAAAAAEDAAEVAVA